MNKEQLSYALCDIREEYVIEALNYCTEKRTSGPERNRFSGKRLWLIAAIIVCFVALSAFAASIFSPLDGDALTLRGTYAGEGIVLIQVENRSGKKIDFQPEVKLVKWITEEEISQLGGVAVFERSSVAPRTTMTIQIDLSDVFDISALEQTKPWEWYYLLLTNRDFAYGQEWKCSINFHPEAEPTEENAKAIYTLDPVIISQIHEELRYYFEDDYIGIFAANPLNYDYMQRAQELLMRSGKRIVPMADAPIISEPLPEGLVVDDTFPLEKQYTLAGNTTSVRDAFGKLVGATQFEKVHIIQVSMPAYKGSQDQSWSLPLLFVASFEKELIHSGDDCAFIYGQIVSFDSLEPNKVFEDAVYVSFDVTHLFYTDIRSYVENVVAMELAGGNSNVYFDEQAYNRVENILDYFVNNLSVVSLEDYSDNIRPKCVISDYPSADALVKDGLSGTIEANRDIRKVIFTIAAYEGEEIYRKEYSPVDPRFFSLSDAKEVTEYIQTLEEGVYTLDVSVRLDSDVMAFQSIWSQVFVTGNAPMPGVG